jgi:hypothetical protein
MIVAVLLLMYLASLRYYIVANPVTGSRADGINGSFQVKRAKMRDLFGIASIKSERIGGACLAFRAKDLGYNQMAKLSCTSNQQCVDSGEAGKGAYCHVPTGTCWAKPLNVNLCRRSSDLGPNQLPLGPWASGTDHAIVGTPVKASEFSLKPNAQARVIACLNATGSSDCATADSDNRQVDMGPPLDIP